MEKQKIITTLGFIGTCIAILMFISLLEIAKNNIEGGTNIVIQPIITTVNCVTWSIYAYLKKEKFVFWANFPGVILGLVATATAFI